MSGKITLITGGARSGKSAFAEKLCHEKKGRVGYIATAAALDEGMIERIKRHQARRPGAWTTIEKQVNVHEVFEDPAAQVYDIFLLDCLTVLTTNIMLGDFTIDWDTVSRDTINAIEKDLLEQVESLIHAIMRNDRPVVIVTNEVGLGIVPENRLARVFRDIAGKANEMVAQAAEDVYFVVSGIPMKIKG